MRLWMVFFAAGMALAQEPVRQPSSKGVNFYSLEKEREMGQVPALERDLTIVHDAALDAYVEQLGAALAKYSDSPFGFTFVLYEDRRQAPASEPIAIPGGWIFVPLSLLANAPEEGVFAFQLAHAMEHIALRHGTRSATRTELMQIAATGAGGGMPPAGLAMARAAEREADYMAVQVLGNAGWNPAPMAAYLEDLPEAPGPKALSPRPLNRDRAAAIRKEIEKLPPVDYPAATGGFAEAKTLAGHVR